MTMNKSIKKVPCCGVGNRILLCAFILMVSCAAMPAYAAIGGIVSSGGLDYKVLTEAGATGTVEVGDNSGYVGSNLVIPATVTNGALTYDVVSVGNFAFYECAGLTGTLTLPSSVTAIGDYAFFNCAGITALDLPASGLETIGESAFYGTSITGILTILSVTSIGAGAFTNCTGIAALNLPASGLQTIGNYAFQGTGITGTLTIPSSVIAIGNSAFFNCEDITALNLPAGLDTIGNNAFEGTNISGPLIPSSVTSIGQLAFDGCTNIAALALPASGWLTIGAYAFRGCTGIIGLLTIPSSVTAIGDYAFNGCTSIATLALPASGLQTIGNDAFRGTGIIGTLTIPSSVTAIGDNAFRGTGITTLNLPASGLQTIGNDAFRGCRYIGGTLTVPASVTSIGDAAFFNTDITTLYWRTSHDIPAVTFKNCSYLNAVHVSATTAPSVGTDAFLGVAATGILYHPTSGSGYPTMAASYLPGGWTLQTLEFPVLTLTASLPGLVYPANSVTLTATLTDANSNAIQPIVFTMNGTPIGSPVYTDASGVASTPVTGLTFGTYDFGAFFAGDAVNEPATGIVAGYTVAKADPAFTAPTPVPLTYTGSAQALVLAGTTSPGTMEYSLTSGRGFVTSPPSGTNIRCITE